MNRLNDPGEEYASIVLGALETGESVSGYAIGSPRPDVSRRLRKDRRQRSLVRWQEKARTVERDKAIHRELVDSTIKMAAGLCVIAGIDGVTFECVEVRPRREGRFGFSGTRHPGSFHYRALIGEKVLAGVKRQDPKRASADFLRSVIAKCEKKVRRGQWLNSF